MSKSARIHQSQRSVIPPPWGRALCRRPKPRDFRDRYIELGWESIEEHYGTSWRVICRWIDEEGRQELKGARAAYVRERGFVMLHPAR